MKRETNKIANTKYGVIFCRTIYKTKLKTWHMISLKCCNIYGIKAKIVKGFRVNNMDVFDTEVII